MSESFQTQAIHAGYDPLANGRASVPPIYASAAFDLGDAARGDALAGGDIDGFEYSRVANPTVDALERRLAALEGGIGAVAVGSGMAAFIKRIRIKYLRTFGAVQSPFNAYLSLVGLETLPQRVSQQVVSAQRIAEHLTSAPHVTKVNYSGLGYTPQYELVGKYFPRGVGQILSFQVDGGADSVRRIIDGTKLFSYVPNIGDARSLIVDPARITHREVPAEARIAAGVSDNLIRLSIGLEDVNDLIADLDQAIAAAY